MTHGRHSRLVVVLLAVLGGLVAAAAPMAGSTSPVVARPVIGKPVAVPARPLPGERFTVSFKVTRSDTGAPLLRGTMVCAPSVAGRVIQHVESFKGGKARLSFVVPMRASGNVLKVKVTIRMARQSATRVATFLVRSAAPPSMSIDDASTAEGNTGTTMLVFPVRLSGASGNPVSVSYSSSDGTAKEPLDYARSGGTLTFAPGETVQTVAVAIVGDRVVEQDEVFSITLFGSVNAEIVDGAATGTITNDDTGQSVTAGDYKGATQEGNYVYFSVLATRQISGFRVNALPCRCRPGGGWLEGGEDVGDTLITIRSNGTFAVEVTWTGSRMEDDVEWTTRYVKVTGSFPTPTTARGTVLARYEFNHDGTHYVCNSWSKTWTAELQG